MLVFDEAYYVNAARVIAGIAGRPGAHYAGSPLGDDPNSEHPQLAKLVMAGSIELFGDGPFAWRLGSIVLGSVAILGMYVLVRAAGGGPWLGLGAATLMAVDNLLLVHRPDRDARHLRGGRDDLGRGAVPARTAAARGRGDRRRRLHEARGAVRAAVAAAARAARVVRPAAIAARVRRFAICAVAAAGTFIGLLAVLDRIAPPYDPIAGKLVTGGPFGHLRHMLSYAAHQTSPHGPHGIASYPWEWLSTSSRSST